MNEQQFENAVYLYSQTVAALIEMEGMKAMNLERERNGYALAYDEKAFFDLTTKYQTGYNDAITTLRRGL